MANRYPVTLVGNVVRDPELIGKDGIKFPLAVDTRAKDASGEWSVRDTIFYDVVTWNEKLIDAVQLQVAKGNLLTVTGDLTLRSYEAKDGSRRTGINVEAKSISRDIRLAHDTNESIVAQNQMHNDVSQEVDDPWAPPAPGDARQSSAGSVPPPPPAQSAPEYQHPVTARAAAQEL